MSLIKSLILLDAVTTGTSKPVATGETAKDVVFTFTSIGTTSGGTILIEESDTPSYPGTWSQLASQAASGFTGTVKLCYHIQLGASGWVRARVSSTITGGGTATVTLSGL